MAAKLSIASAAANAQHAPKQYMCTCADKNEVALKNLNILTTRTLILYWGYDVIISPINGRRKIINCCVLDFF
jgi:hypothetical protein